MLNIRQTNQGLVPSSIPAQIATNHMFGPNIERIFLVQIYGK
jgi:hypothetical protein